MNGIDISQWQGDMDLTPYKDGFVIIRGGFWTSADPWAERNIAKCEKLGIPWGLYWYSYALSEAQARQEAEACLEFLAGRKPRLGVWFDMEDADAYKAKNGFPLDETITAMCKAFCAAMEEAGNKTGVYASLSWFDTHIGETGYDRWIAAWGANDGVHYRAVRHAAVPGQPAGSGYFVCAAFVFWRWRGGRSRAPPLRKGRGMRKRLGDGAGGARRKVGQRRGAKAEARRVVLRSRAGRSEPDAGGVR